ncbi:hypothetical protein SRB5_54160 [Streptomyces sp. RB5]|uniref:Uncharacterized protein n=1 Tax=Streptomyces smaragdinus TaxID=2585196 RepID=A0A7K0CP15_9ACTN|nr:hypothetical protein [Streptomyces smaragdinus]MQY15237.1 hypothetical protein [Streptomyces smaragdinus]
MRDGADTTRIEATCLPGEEAAESKKPMDGVAETVARQIRNQQLGADLDAYESEHGAFSDEELAEAHARIRGFEEM